jgi:hypothetical protein
MMIKSVFYLFLAMSSAAWANERPQYCAKPDFAIMNLSLRNDNQDLPLLNPKEEADPEAGRRLASAPGPYGHSELGFRYLARLFGYKGKFGGQKEVEGWIADKLKNDYIRNQGLAEAWDHWVANPVKRFSVPEGYVTDIPAGAGSEIFFQDAIDQANFSHCVLLTLRIQACYNYLGDRHPQEGDRVYLGNPGSPAACKLVRNPYGYEARRKRRLDSGESSGNQINGPGGRASFGAQ